jgi:chemotaxis family two-component system sensor kinase Cph1
MLQCPAAGVVLSERVANQVLKDPTSPPQALSPRLVNEYGIEAQRNRAQNELALKVHELARSNDDLEQFAYAALHDLQEPLRMVATYTQLLSERYRGKLDAEADKYIHYAADGAIRMQMLIRDLLAFSVTGRHDTEVRATDCRAVLRSALFNLIVAVEESGARIKYGDLPVVMSNASQLQQVFQNLIGNAIKFRSSGPPVIQISAQRHNEEWIFSVSDNGIGIMPEHKESVFTIFQRLHTREEYAGNEIGLAICKKIIERHGGTIWTESPPQGGTTFKFTLLAVKREPLNATQLNIVALDQEANMSYITTKERQGSNGEQRMAGLIGGRQSSGHRPHKGHPVAR